MAMGASVMPITAMTGPVTMGGKIFRMNPGPIRATSPAMPRYSRPAHMMPMPIADQLGSSDSAAAARIGGMNAKDDPRKTGTIIFVTTWNNSVPTPAEIRATDGSRSVMSGTRMVAPNIATVC